MAFIAWILGLFRNLFSSNRRQPTDSARAARERFNVSLQVNKLEQRRVLNADAAALAVDDVAAADTTATVANEGDVIEHDVNMNNEAAFDSAGLDLNLTLNDQNALDNNGMPIGMSSTEIASADLTNMLSTDLDSELTTLSTEIVFVDSRVSDYESLIGGARDGLEVVTLDADRDGLEQIAEHLAGRDDVSAIHIVSHGSAGQLILGNSVVNDDNLADFNDELNVIGDSLTADGDLLFYGCDVGAGAAGADFLAAIAEATDADVAASTDDTGAASLGGDWDLEATVGLVNAGNAFTAETQQNYDYILPLVPPSVDLTFAGGTLTINQSGDDQADELNISYDDTTNELIIEDDNNTLDATAIAGAGVSGDASEIRIDLDDFTGTIDTIQVNGNGGGDELTVDFADGDFLAANSIKLEYDGGDNVGFGGDDELIIDGNATFTSLTYDVEGAGEGSLSFDGTNSIDFEGLEPVVVMPVAGTVTINVDPGNAVAGTVTTTITSLGGGMNEASFTGGLESMAFMNPTVELIINGDAMDDDIVTVTSVDAGFDAAVTIDTMGGGAVNDVINLNTALTLGSATSTGNVTLSSDDVNINQSIATGGGDVDIDATNDVTSMAAGSITTTAAANSGVASGAVDIDTTGTGAVSLAGAIVTTGANDDGTSGTASAAGTVDITTTDGAIAVAGITANGGMGTAGNANGGAAAAITLQAAGTNRDVTLNGTLTALGGAGNGAGAAGTGAAVVIAASGGVVDGNAGGLNVSAASASLTASAGDIGALANPLDVSVAGDLDLMLGGATSAAFVTSPADLTIGSLTTGVGANTVSIASTGGNTILLGAALTDGTLAGDAVAVDAGAGGTIDGGTQTLNLGAGTLSLKADTLVNLGAVTATGGLTVAPGTAGATIGLGNLALPNVAAQTFQLDNASLNSLAAAGGGNLTVGDATSGTIVIDEVSFGAQNLTLVTGSTINDNDDANPVAFTSTGILTLTSGGAIGGLNGAEGLNVDVGSLQVTTTGGNAVTVRDAGTSATTYDVATGGAGLVTLTQVSGNLALTQVETTGDATLSALAGAITDADSGATETANITAATATLTATAGIGSGLAGVAGGDIETDVTSLVASTTTGNVIVQELDTGADGLAIGAGDVTTAGGAVRLSVAGILTSAVGADIVTTAAAGVASGAVDIDTTGAVTLAGDIVTSGGGAGSDGGQIDIDTTGGAIAVGNVTATAGAGGTAGNINFDAGSGTFSVSAASSVDTTADVSITADDVTLDTSGTPAAISGSTVAIQNSTAARAINLGTDTDLGLTAAELDTITADTLIIGRNDSNAAGTITVSDQIDLTGNANTLILLTGANVVDGTGTEQTDLTVGSLGIDAVSGIGSTAADGDLDVETSSTTLAMTTVTGDIVISDTSLTGATIGTVGGTTGITITGTGGGLIDVEATNDTLTVNEVVSNAGTASTSTIRLAGLGVDLATANAEVTATAGEVMIDAGTGSFNMASGARINAAADVTIIADDVSIAPSGVGNGELTFVEALTDGGMDGSGTVINGLDGARTVSVSPDGLHAYVTGRDDNAIVVFSRDPASGVLTFVETLNDGGMDGSGNVIDGLNSARSVTVSPDGAHVYVAGRDDDAIAVFSRDAATGELTFVEILRDGGMDGSSNTIDGLDSIRTVVVSPDGAHVYAAGLEDDAVAVFSRNAVTGELTFVETLTDGGMDGSGNIVSGLEFAVELTVSPDGSHVYVSSAGSDAIAVFARNAGTGELTFVESLFDGGMDGSGNLIDGLDRAISVSVSPDGAHVYVSGANDNAVAVFSRNATTGELTFVETLTDGGMDGSGNVIDGLAGVRSVEVSTDGVHVYVAGQDDDAVAVFTRNATTGRLTFIGNLTDGGMDGSGNTVDGLEAANFVTVSPDGRQIYVTAETDDSVAVFSRSGAIRTTGLDSTVTIQNTTTGQAINLGTDTVGSLSLTDAELDRITANTIVIGRNDGAASGDITLSDSIDLSNNTTTLSLRTGDAIVDATGTEQADITVTNLAIRAGDGIGIVDEIDVNVTTLAFINSTMGEVAVFDTAGGLTIDTVDGVSASSSAGAAFITAASPLTISHDMSVTANSIFTAGDSAAANDDLTINNGAVVTLTNAANRIVRFQAGDDIIFDTGSIVATGGGTHTIFLIADRDSAGVGAADGDSGSVTQTGMTVSVTTDLLDIDAFDGVGDSSGDAGTTANNALRISVATLDVSNTGLNDIFTTSDQNLTISQLTTAANQTDTINISTTSGATLTLTGTDGYTNLDDGGDGGDDGDNVILNADGTLTIETTAIEARSFDIDTSGDQVNLDISVTADQGIAIDTAGGNLADMGTPTITVGTLLDVDLGAGNGTIDGVIAGAGGLTQAGSGTLTLAGANTYAAATTVDAGTLEITGSTDSATTVNNSAELRLDNTGGAGTGEIDATVTLNGDSRLTGTGTIVDALNVNGTATVAPGFSPGIMNSGDANFAAGTEFEVEFDDDTIGVPTAGTDHDQLNVTGTVTLDTTGAGVALDLADLGSLSVDAGDVYVLINNDGTDAITGIFTTVTTNAGATTINIGGDGLQGSEQFEFNGVTFEASYAGGSDANDFVLTVVAIAPTITGTAGVDNFVVYREEAGTMGDDTDDRLIVERDGVVVLNTLLSGVTDLTIDGADGADTLTVDYTDGTTHTAGDSDGFFVLQSSGTITFNGQNPTVATGDSLIINDSADATIVTVTHTFTNESDGSVQIVSQASGTANIAYTGLEPVTDNMIAANREFTFNAGAETITLTDTGGADGMMTIDSDVGGESVEFVNPTETLTINAGSGIDIVNITSVDAAYRAALTINGDADADTVNINTDLTLGSGAVTGNLSVTAETIVVDNIADGNIAIDTTGGTTDGSVSLTGGTNITMNAGSSITTGTGTITIDGETGAVVLSGGTLTTTNSTAAAVSITDTSSIAVGTISAVNGTVTMASTGAITDGNAAANNVSAMTLIANAGTGIALDTTVAALTASTSAAGDIDIDEADGITLTDVDTANGSITIDAGGTMTATDVASLTDADANDITLTTTVGNIVVGVINAGALGDVTLDAAGSITDGNGSGTLNITADVLTMDAGGSIDVDTDVNSIDASTSASGAISIREAGAVTLTDVDTADGSITVAAGGTITATDVVSTTDDDTNDISLTATGGGDIEVGAINAGGTDGDVTLDAAGAITDDNAAVLNITADVLTMDAATGVGDGDALETTVATLDVDNTTSGDILITDTIAVSVLQLDQDAMTGAVTLIAAGTITVVTAQSGVTSREGTVTLTANGAGSDVVINHLVTTVGGDVDIDAADMVTSTDMDDITTTAAAGTASGAVDIDAGGAVMLAGDIITTGGGAGSNGGQVDIDTTSGAIAVSDITASPGTGATAGDINLHANGAAVGSVTINGALTSSDGTVRVDAATNIVDGSADATTDIAAANVLLRATTGIGAGTAGAATDINTATTGTTATTLTFAAETDSGDINIANSGSFTVDSVAMGTSSIAGVTGVTILDVADNNNGEDITLRAASPLTINAAVVNMAGGDITQAAEGAMDADDLTIAANITATGGNGNINLFAGDDIAHNSGTISAVGTGTILLSAGEDFNGGMNQNGNASGDITQAETGIVTSVSGNVTMRATDNITLGSITSTMASVIVTADFDNGIGADISDGVGAINDNAGNTDADITAATVDLDAATGIGTTAAMVIELVGATSIDADTTGGNIDIDNAVTAATAVNSMTTGTGNISYNQSGNQLLTLTSVMTTDGNVTITNAEMADADILVGVISTDTTDDTVSLTADGAIDAVANNAAAEIVAATISLIATDSGIGQNGNSFDVNATVGFNADTSIDGADITVDDIAGDFPIGAITAGAGTVTLTSVGAITDANASDDSVKNITAGTVDLTAATGVGAGTVAGTNADLDTAVTTFTTVDGGVGPINIDNMLGAGTVTVTAMATTDDTITFTQSGGADIDFDGAISSNDANNGDPTADIRLIADAGLTVTATGTVSSLAGTGGTLTLGGGTILGMITVGAGDITIQGGGLDTIIDDAIASAGPIGITALRDVLVRNSVSTTSGDITIMADTDGLSNMDASGSAQGGVLITAAGLVDGAANVTISGSDLLNLGAAAGTVESVQIDADAVAGTNQIEADGQLTIRSNTMALDGVTAPAAADIIINGRVESTLSSTMPAAPPIRVTANDDIIFNNGAMPADNDGSLNSIGLVIATATGGAIVDAEAGVESTLITAEDLVFRAATGIGADGATGDIETATFVGDPTLTLAAQTESGDINIINTGSFTIGTVDGLSGVTIVDAAANDTGDDNITLIAASPLTVAAGPVNTTLTADANIGATMITLASTAGLSVGDLVHLSDDDGSAESLVILTVDSGTQITLVSAVTQNFTTAQNARLRVGGVINNDGGDIVLTAMTDGDVTINADIQVTDEAAMGDDGQIVITAEGGDIHHNSGTVSTVGGDNTTTSGRIQYNAAEVITVGDSTAANAAAVIRTVDGNIDMDASPAAPTTPNARGISFEDAATMAANEVLVETTTGNIDIDGTGASDGSTLSNFGVFVGGGTTIRSTGIESGTEIGSITIDGTGGAGDDFNDGVLVSGAGTTVTSIDGNIVLQGTGGSNGLADSDFNRGVRISAGAVVSSTGMDVAGRTAALVTITGTGGAGEDNNDGVVIRNSNTQVTSVDGDIVISGTAGGDGSNNKGVAVATTAQVTSTAANITITGIQGANPTGDNNDGILIASDADISGTGGTVSLTGIGAGTTADSENDGVQITGTGTTVMAGTLDIDGTGNGSEDDNDGVQISAGAVVTVTGTADIRGTGGSASSASRNHGVLITGNDGAGTDTSLSAGRLTIIGSGRGDRTGNAGVEISANADVTVNGTGALTITGTGISESISDGVLITGGGTTVMAGSADIDGTSSVPPTEISNHDGVEISAGAVVTIAGTALVDGTGTGGEGGNNDGVFINGMNTEFNAGTATINGTGFAGSTGASDDTGVEISGGAAVTIDNAAIINGTGGGNNSEDRNDGVLITGNGTQLTTGNLTITGSGRGEEENNTGVEISNQANVMVTGTAMITGTGRSDQGDDNNDGVLIASNADVTITGTATIIGSGGGANSVNENDGVQITGTGTTLAADGLTITGTGSGETGGNDGVEISAGATVTVADGIDIDGTGGAGSTGNDNNGILITGTGTRVTDNSMTPPTIDMDGTGMGTGSDNDGIEISGGAIVEGTDAAMVQLDGTGSAAGTGTDNDGVEISGNDGMGVSSTVSSVNGDITITGTAGDGTDDNTGVEVSNTAQVISTAANITITGTQGASPIGENNDGILIASNADISGTGGTVTLTGTGGGIVAFQENEGVEITGTGTTVMAGTLDIDGTTLGIESNNGVELAAGAVVTVTGTGDIRGTSGMAASSQDNKGVLITGTDGAGTDTSLTAENLTIIGSGMGDNGNRNNGVEISDEADINSTGDGTLTITGTGAGEGTIDGVLITNTDTTVRADEIDFDGTATVTGDGFDGDGVEISDGAEVETTRAFIDGTGTGGEGGDNDGVLFTRDSLFIAVTATITGTGFAGADGTDDTGVEISLQAMVEIENTAVISGTGGGAGSDARNDGVLVTDEARLTAGAGDLTITGTGRGSQGLNDGVEFSGGARVTATTGINIDGTGGTDSVDDNHGVFITGANTTVTHTGMTGAIDIDGTSLGAGSRNEGVDISLNSLVTSTGTAPIQIDGTGSTSGMLDNRGIYMDRGEVRSISGDVTLIGTGGSGVVGNEGVHLINATVRIDGSANVIVNGTAGEGPDPDSRSQDGVRIVDSLVGDDNEIFGGMDLTGDATGFIIIDANSDRLQLQGATVRTNADGEGTVSRIILSSNQIDIRNGENGASLVQALSQNGGQGEIVAAPDGSPDNLTTNPVNVELGAGARDTDLGNNQDIFGLTDAELNTFEARVVRIGSADILVPGNTPKLTNQFGDNVNQDGAPMPPAPVDPMNPTIEERNMMLAQPYVTSTQSTISVVGNFEADAAFATDLFQLRTNGTTGTQTIAINPGSAVMDLTVDLATNNPGRHFEAYAGFDITQEDADVVTATPGSSADDRDLIDIQPTSVDGDPVFRDGDIHYRAERSITISGASGIFTEDGEITLAANLPVFTADLNTANDGDTITITGVDGSTLIIEFDTNSNQTVAGSMLLDLTILTNDDELAAAIVNLINTPDGFSAELQEKISPDHPNHFIIEPARHVEVSNPTAVMSTQANGTFDGVQIIMSDVFTGVDTNAMTVAPTLGGDILIAGRAGGQAPENDLDGVLLQTSSVESISMDDPTDADGNGITEAGSITILGTGGPGVDNNDGVEIINAGGVMSVDGDIIIAGRGGSDGSAMSDNNRGVAIGTGASVVSSGSDTGGRTAASITICGIGANGMLDNDGVEIDGMTTMVTSADGAIDIDGTGGSNGMAGSNQNRGVQVSGGADIRSTGTSSAAATITIDGTGGAGEDFNDGVFTIGVERTSPVWSAISSSVGPAG